MNPYSHGKNQAALKIERKGYIANCPFKDAIERMQWRQGYEDGLMDYA